MKRRWIILLTACLLGAMSVPAAALTLPGEEVWADVLARFEESFDENTAVVDGTDGIFTMTARDGAVLTVAVPPDALPPGVRLMVITVPEGGDAYRWFFSVLDKGRLRAYALYFVKDGERISFEGELTLSVTAPEGMGQMRIFLVSPDGATRELPFEARDGLLRLTAKYEAPYIVIADAAGPVGIPETGDAGFQGWIAVMGAAALALLMPNRRHDIQKKKEDARWS